LVPPAALYPLFGFLFEAPLAALATAAAAAALPIIIHLLNRKRFRVITWAAMRFLLAAQRKNTRRMRLEQLLLLAVRTLLVLLLVAAMASVMPWSEEIWFRLFPDSALQAATDGRRTYKILVIDGSLSMALKLGDTTCFDRARDQASRILGESASGDGFSVVLMAAPPRRVVPEASEDAGKVAAEIQALRLPHGNADVGATLSVIDDLLRRSPGKFEEREVYFLSDMQRSTWTARQSGDPVGVLPRIQGRARTIFVDVGQDGVDNVAVSNLTVALPFVTTGAITPVVATLHNYGGEPRKQVRIELHVGRARAAAGDPPFALHLAGHKSVDLLPGQNVVSFPHKFTTPGDYAVQVRVENDALELDDTRTVVLRVKDNVPVVLVNGKPAAEIYDRATEWLSDALNPFQGGTAPREFAARARVVTESQFADAGLGDLTPYDCVFLCDLARLDAAEVRRLEAHLHRGGGVVFCLGPRVDLESYNRLLFRNGEGLLPARLMGLQAAPERRYFNLFAEEKDYHVPPLDAFGSEQDRIGLLTARFQQYVRAELLPRSNARKILSFMPEATTVSAGATERDVGMILPVGDPAVVEWSRHRGRVILFTSTVNMDWTSWPLSPSFPAFIQELLHFAVAGRLREQAALAGDTLEQYLAAGSAGLEATWYTPQGQSSTARTEDRDEGGVLRWTDTDISGIYRATLGQHPQEYLFAVNVPTAAAAQGTSESDLARTNQAELQSLYPHWDFQWVTDLRQAVHTGRTKAPSAAPRPARGLGMFVARWLLLGMMLLSLLEVLLAWHFGHYSSVSGTLGTPPTRGALLPAAIGGMAGVLFVTLAAVLAHAAWTGDFLGFLPESARTGIEQYLGIPPPAAGEGTRWHLQFSPYLRDAAADPWLAGGLALVVAVAVVLIYLREGRTASWVYKLLLAGLRMFLVLLTLVVLLPQVRLLFERESWPDLAILIDDSGSMSTRDDYDDARQREAVARLLDYDAAPDSAALPAPERLRLAQALLTRGASPWLDHLLTRRRVKLHVYHCSTRAGRLTDASVPSELKDAVRAVQELRADGESSQLGGAVRQVLNDFRGTSLAAVVMLTDGVTTEGEDLPRVARYAAQVGVPLFFVGIGDAKEAHGLRLHDLQVEDSVYVNDRLIFEARLTARGYSDGRSVPVTLSERAKDGRLKELASERVKTDPEGKPVKFRLVHQPREPGERTYVLEVPVQADEVKPADQHRLERAVLVHDARPIKVFYVEGYARYEYRYLKHLLERETDKEKGKQSIDLKVLLLDADSQYASEDKSALADFPTKEELNAFDVVIFGDVDPKDPRVGERNLQNLADFVKERGGGLLMIAGPRCYSPQAYKNTPLADVLPVQVTGPPPAISDHPTGYRPELTATGRFHPIFRFSPDEVENSAIWNSLPELFWWSEGYRKQPAAEVLLVHPARPAADPGRGGAEPHPLALQQFMGAGRSMFFGFDETWHWRLRDKEARFNQFWLQTVRHLARSRVGRIDLRLDRQTPYRRGEPIRVIVRFPDESSPPGPDTNVEVVVTRTPLGGAGQRLAGLEKETLRLTKVEGSRATFAGLLSRTPEGNYRFWLSSPLVADPKPAAEGRVLPPPGEMEQLRLNQSGMEQAAELTHGHFYTVANADRLLEDLPAGARITVSTPQPPRLLWNHPLVFALALGLFGAEWVLRKRKHLL
jgi:hypothetical protein